MKIIVGIIYLVFIGISIYLNDNDMRPPHWRDRTWLLAIVVFSMPFVIGFLLAPSE
jgi:hypothetical protein